MPKRRIEFLPSFIAAYRKLPVHLHAPVDEAVRHFVERSNETALKVEKKAGPKGIWAFRVDRGWRIFFVQGRDGQGRTVDRLFHVGEHDDYATVARKRPR